jgi:DNA helicase-2/ATP-dependent DNA helicase PcrA
LLRQYAQKVGLDRNFVILDTEDKNRLIRELVRELNLDPELYSPKGISSLISNVKNGLYTLDSLQSYYDRLTQLYVLYNEKLRSMNALDFDDLLLFGRELLEDDSLRSYLSSYFQYLLIDEYQDTNRVQYEIAKALTLERGNICVVGDEDQCIYSWRGANIDNILSFEKDFKNAKLIKLEKNYRCSRIILEAANAVIANNTLRKGKKLYTDNPPGELIRLYRAENEVDEAIFVAKTIKRLISSKVSPSEIAVFYRTNSLSRVVEDQLRKEGIPYQIVGGVKFYERKEVKDLLAYIRLLTFEKDELALFRVLNVPKRGLGLGTQEKLKELLKESSSNLEALEKLREKLNQAKQRKAVTSFIELIKQLKEKIESLPPYDFIKYLTLLIEYESYLKKESPEDWESRLENVKELGNTIQEFAEREGLKGAELYREFLASVTLSSEQDQLEEGEKVILMTVHASKGLEFPVVFITGLEEGLFPHSRSLDSREEVEEERRLFYVAVTRAKKLLTLSYAKERRSFGTRRSTTPSRFISEIPSHLIKEVRKRVKKELPASERSSSDSKALRKPKLVYHPKFGKGVVRRVEGAGESAKVTAFYANFGEKTVIMKFLKILA